MLEWWVCAKGEWLFLKEPWLSLVGVAVVHAPATQAHCGVEKKEKEGPRLTHVRQHTTCKGIILAEGIHSLLLDKCKACLHSHLLHACTQQCCMQRTAPDVTQVAHKSLSSYCTELHKPSAVGAKTRSPLQWGQGLTPLCSGGKDSLPSAVGTMTHSPLQWVPGLTSNRASHEHKVGVGLVQAA